MGMTLCNKSKDVSFIMLCICMAHVMFFGTAAFLFAGRISLWHILVALTVFAAIPAVIRNFRSIFTNAYFYALVAFAAWLIVAAVIGRGNDHGMAYIVRDMKSFAYLALFPVMMCIIRDRERVQLLLKFAMYASFALSVLTACFMLMYILAPETSRTLLRLFWRLDFINFTQISPQLARVLFVSTPFQMFGCGIPFYFQAKGSRFSWLYPIITGLGLFCVLISYTRALYLATFVAAAAVMVLTLVAVGREGRKRIWLHIGVSVGVLLTVTLILSALAKFNYMGYAVQRVFVTGQQKEYFEPDGDDTTKDGEKGEGQEENIPDKSTTEIIIPEFNDGDSYLEATKASDATREALKVGLLKEIKKSPIIGNGLGLTVNGRESLPELFIYDLVAKAGLIGLLLYLAPFLMAVAVCIRSIKKHTHFLELYIWTGCTAGLFAYSCFQPYMNNAPCMMIYSCLMCIALLQSGDLRKKNMEEQI